MDPSIASMLNKTQRLILGVLILILVDVICVSATELTNYIYRNVDFEKPFFSTYVRMSMFSLYLVGFLFYPPWKDNYCSKPTHYVYLDPEQEDEAYYSAEAGSSLSNPIYVPVKTPEKESFDRSSGTESDDSSVRSVRFNKMAEVRHMSEAEATEALLARLSYQASLKAGELAKRVASKLSIVKIAKVALVYSLLWFVSQYLYQLALLKGNSTITTVIWFSLTLLTTFSISAFSSTHPYDRLSLSKFIGIMICITGIIYIGLSNLSKSSPSLLDTFGWGLSLISSFFYGLYLAFLRKQIDREDRADIPLFAGYVGLFSMIFLWPLFFLLHFSDIEKFELPTREQLMFLIINSIFRTVIPEVLWLWGFFLTSSLTATAAKCLTLPMTMVAEVILQRIAYPSFFCLGTVFLVLGFAVIVLLTYFENWDPAYSVLYCFCTGLCRRTRTARFRLSDNTRSEQHEALIGINSSDHEA